MLVVQRRKNEEVCIDDKIRVRLIHVGRNRVRLGVEAPKDVHIERKELHDRRQQKCVEAASPESAAERDA